MNKRKNDDPPGGEPIPPTGGHDVAPDEFVTLEEQKK